MTKRDWQAHHIVATKEPRAAYARVILQRAGIGPNDVANGVWMRACEHRCMHTKLYYRNVNAVLRRIEGPPYPSRLQVQWALQDVARMVQNGSFPVR